MKSYFYLFVLACVAMVSFPGGAFAIYKATKFTVVVVSEEGEPLSGVKVGVGFEENTGWGTDSSGQQRVTDADGRSEFSGQSNGHVTYGGSKEGYYPSYYDYDFKDLGTFGWEPWNPKLKIVMHKIENPVPMYIRDTKMYKKRVEIPVVGKDVGFDLIEYDWVTPYGDGRYADFIFNLKSRFSSISDYDFILTLKFKDWNGIQPYEEDINQGSVFKLPRYAPNDGYLNAFKTYVRRNPGEGVEDTDDRQRNFVFRIRTTSENGSIKSAMYGKILGDIVLMPQKDGKAKVDFKYYLNPDGTRNLEHDLKRNLFYE